MMKRLSRSIAAPALAAALLLGVTAVPAAAYFTASDYANGGITIKIPSTDIIEYYDNAEKQVFIQNKEDSVPVWVRARVYGAEELGPQVSGTGWEDGGDGWWYYYPNDGSKGVLQPGEQVETPLVAKIEWPYKDVDVNKEDGTVTTIVDTGGEDGGTSEVTVSTAWGTNYNIVVVYEALPTVYDADGNPLPAEW